MKRHIPMALTWIRVGLVPVMAVIYLSPWHLGHAIAAVLFACASVSDWLDGALARHWQVTTAFGAFLDPVADKILVSTVLIALVHKQPQLWLAIPAMLIIGREIIISALREWMAQRGQSDKVAVHFSGKLKTAFQMGAMLLLLAFETGVVHNSGIVLLNIAAGLSLYSLVGYFRSAWVAMNLDKQASIN